MEVQGKEVYTRMGIRRFRASVKSGMELPIVVTCDGQDAFVVLPPGPLWKLPLEFPCPSCEGRLVLTGQWLVRTSKPASIERST